MAHLPRPEGVRPGELRNGQKHGLWVENDGYQLSLFERLYLDGVKHGLEREWCDHHLASVCEFVDGKRHGVRRRFYGDGSVAQETPYVDGEAYGIERSYAPDGTLTAE